MFVRIDGYQYWATRELTPQELQGSELVQIDDSALVDVRSVPLWRMMIVRERFASQMDMDELMNRRHVAINGYLQNPDVLAAARKLQTATTYQDRFYFTAIIDEIAHSTLQALRKSELMAAAFGKPSLVRIK